MRVFCGLSSNPKTGDDMKRVLLLSSVLSLIACGRADADSITLKNGYTATGTILQTNSVDDTVLLLRDYWTSTFFIPTIQTVKIESPEAVASLPNTNRTPDWKRILLRLSTRPWAQNLKQIPATVIDKGILRNVPYVSFRCGEDYEVNIYGDLDNPAGFEIGVYRKLVSDDTAKDNCMRFVEALFPDSADKETVMKLKREKDSTTRDGLTFEVTAPTAEDAYFGWWVSIYDEKRLNFARASESELKQISVTKTPPTTEPAATQETPGWSAEELELARPAQAYQSRFNPAGGGYRPPRAATPSPTYNPTSAYNYSPSIAGGGRVYVRGYTRKDGTYVQPHTGSSARRR